MCYQHGLPFKSFPITRTMRACAWKGLQEPYPFNLPQLLGGGLSRDCCGAVQAISRLASNTGGKAAFHPHSAPSGAECQQEHSQGCANKRSQTGLISRMYFICSNTELRKEDSGLHFSRMRRLDCIKQTQQFLSIAHATVTEQQRKVTQTLYTIAMPCSF